APRLGAGAAPPPRPAWRRAAPRRPARARGRRAAAAGADRGGCPRGSALVSAAASRRREWALGLGVALLALLIRAPLFDLPFERDEGGYAYIAWRLEHGELPYREWFDQKPPGIFLAYRLALAAPGDPVPAIRGLAALASAGAALALYLLA